MSEKKTLDQGQELLDENNFGDFSKAAPLPVAKQPLNDLSPNQTQSHHLLHFTIEDETKSIFKKNYHPIKAQELKKLNRYALNLQSAAQWYLEELSDSKISYFYVDDKEVKTLQVDFRKENFLHLTGVFPLKEGQSAEKSIDDFARGMGNFDNILISNRGAAFDKIQVIPQLPDLIEAQAFVFDDLSEVERFKRLNTDKAIRAVDKDVALAIRTIDETNYPASLLKLKSKINIELDQTNGQKIILGVFREKNNEVKKLSINSDFIKDDGAELLNILKEEIIQKEIQMSSEHTLDDNTSLSRDELDVREEFLTMLQDGEDSRDISVGGARYTLSIKDKNMDQRGKQEIIFLLDSHDGAEVREAVFKKTSERGTMSGSVVNHNFDPDDITRMNQHPLLLKELHERVQRQLPQTETQRPVAEETIESESETIKRLHNESKASAVRQADDGKKMFEFQYYDELVPGSYDAEKQTVKINFTARDTITFQPHQFVAEADVLSTIDKGKKVRLSTARFFENNQDILKKLGVLEWRESNKKFKVTLPEDKELVKEKLEASIQSKQSDVRSSNNLEEVAQLSGEIDTLEDQLEIIDTEDKPVSITEEKLSDLSLQELIAQKDLKGIEAHIRDGIDQYLDSDTFKKYLDFACQFRQYSYRNKILIQAQNPKASLVAGYRAWQNKGRQVQRGQKALKIFAPNLVAKKGKDGKYLRDDEGKVIKEVKGYYLTSVYDVRQTEGEPVPKPIYVLEENITNPQRYGWYIAAITQLSPVPIQFREIKDGARGQFIPSQRQIIIQEGMSQSQTIKTMLHEITHAMLHDIPVPPFGSPEYAQHEIEAESVAYMVANSLGIETQEYSFGYLASWTDLGLSMGRLEKSLDLICQQAQKMMSELDDILKETPIQEQSQEKEKQEAKQTAPRQQSSIKIHM